MSHPAFHNSSDFFGLAIREVYGPDITDEYKEVQKKLLKAYTDGVDKDDKREMDKRLVQVQILKFVVLEIYSDYKKGIVVSIRKAEDSRILIRSSIPVHRRLLLQHRCP